MRVEIGGVESLRDSGWTLVKPRNDRSEADRKILGKKPLELVLRASEGMSYADHLHRADIALKESNNNVT